LIYVSTSGGIYSVAMADGAYEQLGQLEGFGPALLPPALAGDQLYLVDLQGLLIRFDLSEGGEHWRVETAGLSQNAASPEGERVLLAVAQPDGVVASAFETATGRPLWQQKVEPSASGGTTSLLEAGRFYFTAGALHVLDAATGESLWVSSGSFAPSQIIILDDWIYSIGHDENEWALAAWDKATGESRLFKAVEFEGFPNLLGGLAGGAGRLVLLLQDGTLVTFDAASGAELWRQAPAGAPAGAPVIYQDVILLLTKGNHLIARSLEDGHLLGDFTLASDTGLQDFSSARPLVIDGELYAAFYQTPFGLRLKE
jgi:outer membrane protein assembly factor BamB